MLRILNDITAGKGKEGDIALLEELAEFMGDASLCALGKTAANPVMSTLKYFRQEYEAHIKEKRCPTRVCKAMVTYAIDPKKCKACGSCAKVCPTKAITKTDKVHVIDQAKCIKCGSCLPACPKKFQAVLKLSGKEAVGAA